MQYLYKELGLIAYETAWQAMKKMTEERRRETLDEIWFLQHPSIYTQGLAGKPEHILSLDEDIPIVHSDRGGQITYHGPGQLMVYLLLDLQRKNLSIKGLVRSLEQSVMALLAEYGILSHTLAHAPGVYVNQAKIASIGLRVKRGCSYHGLSFNINMDLKPFDRIHPCGYPGLKLVNLSDLLPQPIPSPTCLIKPLLNQLNHHLGYAHEPR